MPTFLRRTLKVLLGLLTLIVLIVVGGVVALQFPATQDYVARRAEGWLRDKLKTDVRIARFRTDFRHDVNLDGVYLADQHRDTLLAVGHLGVSIDLWALTKSQINIKEIELNDGRVRLIRTTPDSINNFDFIVAAFADPNAPVDTTSAGFKYNIGRARLTNIYFTQLDEVTGADIRARLGTALVTMDEMDVDRSIYRVDEVIVQRAGVAIRQTKTAPEVEEPGPTDPLTVQFGLKHARLETVAFSYRNTPAAQFISTNVGLADVTARNIDLPRERIDLNKLTLQNARIAYAQNEPHPLAPSPIGRGDNTAVGSPKSPPLPTGAGSGGWSITLAESAINGVAFQFDNFDEPRQQTRLPALDYNHLSFTDLTLNTRDLTFTEARTTVNVEQLAGREQSGFRVDGLRAQVVYAPGDGEVESLNGSEVTSHSATTGEIRLDSLKLTTPHTHIARTLAIGYESLDALADPKQLPNLRIEGDFADTRIGFRDILYLAPGLATTPPFSNNPNDLVYLSGQIAGRVGDFTVRNLAVRGLGGTVARLRSGHIQGLPETDGRLRTDLDITEFRTTRADILSLVPPGTIPNNISLPPTIALHGRFSGRPTTLQFTTNATVTTSYGAVTFNGEFGAAQAQGRQPLTGTFAVRSFDAGRLLKNPQLGRITATGRLQATGNLQNPATLVGRLTADVQRAEYNGYAYHDLATTVDIDRNRYHLNATSARDPNLAFAVNGVVDLRNPKVPAYAFTAHIQRANLQALRLSTTPLSVQGDFVADLRGADANSLNGTFSGRRVAVVQNGQLIALDSMQGRLVQTAGRTAFDFDSNVLAAHLDGNVPLGQLGPEVQSHLNRYYTLAGVKPLPASGDQRFSYSVKLKNTRLVRQLVPGLRRLSPFELTGEYSRAAARLTANTRINRIRYQNYRLDSLRLAIDSNPQQLTYDLRLAQAAQDTTLKLRRPSVTGNLANNVLTTRVAILGDSANRERLALAGTARFLPVSPPYRGGVGGGVEFVAAPEQIINYQRWTAGVDNYVRYYPTGALVASNLRLSNGRSTLTLQSVDPSQTSSPLRVAFNEFQLGELARIVQQRDSLVAGTLNGTAEIRGLGTAQLGIIADATITNLIFQQAPIGDVALQARNTTAGRYDVEIRLTGGAPAGQPGNDVRLTGYYLLPLPPSPVGKGSENIPPMGSLHFTLTAQRLNLKLAEPFAAGQLAGTSGALNGELTITGTADAPQIRGVMTTTGDAGFVVPQLGSPFRLPDQTITFDERGLGFRNFTVLDSASNRAVLNGYLLTQNYVDYRFDLRATTDHFMAVRSTRQNNELYYGRLFIDSETTLHGPLTLYSIDTRATVADGSNLTIEMPTEDPALVERRGIVRFVDKSLPLDSLLARQLSEDTAAAQAQGYELRAVITVTDRTPFTVVIDPASGDNLKVRANGTLNTGIDPQGNITLTGQLAVAEGSYRLSLYDIARRDFSIEPGSTISWSGDPYNADLNLTAAYKVRTAPANLLAGQGIDDATYNTVARNQLPFTVQLKLTNNLSKPDIGFDITLPEEKRGELGGQVEAKLVQLRQPSQTSEMSKQVFSLLVLGRFTQQNPFESSKGEGFLASQLRGSASSVLTDQLQSLTDKYLGNLGLDLGVSSQADFSSGEARSRTDLNVALRRQLFNDRLTVRVGTDVPLSGGTGNQATNGTSSASTFGGDVSLEYRVLPDGRLRLRAYRQNGYEDIDGQIVRTGTGLIYQRDYRSFPELFKSVPKEVKQERKENRRQEKADKKAVAADTTRREEEVTTSEK